MTMAKKITTTAVATLETKSADTAHLVADQVVDVSGLAQITDFAVQIGVELHGSLDERADAAALHMNRSQRHALAAGVLLLSIKADCKHGEFMGLVAQRGFAHRTAQNAMAYAQFMLGRPADERLRLIEIPRSKLMEIASADPEVIQTLLEDGGESIDALSVRALRQRITELEAATTDLTVQRDTAEAEAEGLRKKVKRGLPERQDQVPLVVADLRAEIMALGKKASLALDSFSGLASELMALVGTDAAHDWADATVRLGASQLAALAVQLNGVLRYYASALPGEDMTPTPRSYLTKQEVAEAAKTFAELAQLHDYERALREWEREQQRPKGKGRPKAKPEAPAAAAGGAA